MIWPSKVGMVGLSIKKNRKSISSQKNSKKGFTLVELIVVLVILAILAAFSVPALLGYIDYTKNKKLITEAESAMSATETMLSDAYTDGLKYLPRRVRDSALATSGLADTTEFVIKTVDSFQLADGTYKSMKSYTVSTALYKAEDGSYVYFDGSDWRVLDNKADSDKTIIAGQTTGNNYIVVWPSGSEKAATDSASSDNNSVAKDDNDETVITIDTEDEESKIDDHNDGKEDSTESTTPVVNYDTVTLILKGSVESSGIDNVRFIDNNFGKLSGSTSKVVEFADGSDTFTATYTENDEGSGDLDSNPSYSCADTTLLDQTAIEWVKEDDTAVAYADIDGVCDYLDTVVNDENITAVTFVARVKEQSLKNIPVSFLAYDKTTQTVEVEGAASDKDGDGKKDTIDAEYGLISGAVACGFNSNDVKVSQVSKGTGNEGAITFDNLWAIKDPNGGTSTGGGPECIKTDDGKKYLRSSIDELGDKITDQIKDILDSNGDDAITADEVTSNSSKCSVVFYAPADINKTLFVRGEVENNNYVGIVSFKTAKNYSFEESFVKNELDGEIYKKADSAKANALKFEGDGAYSLFADNTMILTDDSLKVKWWYLYKCNLKMSAAELMNESALASDDKIRGKDYKNSTGGITNADLSKCLIKDKLYKEGNEKYGELAVVDFSGITTMYEKASSYTAQSPIRTYLRDMADTHVDNIRHIYYIKNDQAEKNPDNTFIERCLSSTKVTVTNNKLERDKNGNFVVSKYDDDYPAYTVAYSKRYAYPNSPNSYKYYFDIYIVTEDDTDIKVSDTLMQYHSNFQILESDSSLARLETSEVKNMEGMFMDCKKLTSLDVSTINTSNVITMKEMFRGCSQIKNLDLSSFDTTNVEDMSFMMYDCNNVEYINVSTFDTEKVETMYGMFGNGGKNWTLKNEKLKELDLTSFKTTKLTSIRDMFIRCEALETIYVDATQWEKDQFDHSNKDAEGGNTFKGCYSLVGGNGTTHPDSGVDVPTDSSLYAIADEPDGIDLNGNGITGEKGYFTDAKRAMFMPINMVDNTNTAWLDSLGFSTKFENMKGFQKYPGEDMTPEKAIALGAKLINDTSYKPEGQDEVIDIYGWYDSNNIFNWWSEAQIVYLNPNTKGMFNFYYGKVVGRPTSLEYVDFGGLDISKMTTFWRFFSNCNNLERIYDGKGTGRDYKFTSDNVDNMMSMFDGCYHLKSVDLSKCNTSHVTTMDHMFMSTASLTELDLSSFSSEKLTNTSFMFRMRDDKYMTINGVQTKISECNQLKSIKFGSGFTCENVSTMEHMFSECRQLETLDLRYFDSVKTQDHNVSLKTENMFKNCVNLRTIIASDPENNNGKGFTNKVGSYQTRFSSTGNMFGGCKKLVGGDGTSTLSSLGNKTDATYARIGKNGQTGLFTDAK